MTGVRGAVLRNAVRLDRFAHHGRNAQLNSAYHLVPEPWYRSQPEDRPYLPEPFDADGFVHLTHGLDDVLAVGNMFYRDDPRPYLLLTIDLGQITSDVRHDDDSQRYPHVYGPLDRAAIVAIQTIERDSDGSFTGVAPDTTTGR
jgi:uncharacterized protein (DUF952 family)